MSRVTAIPSVAAEIAGASLPVEAMRALSEIRIQQRLSQPTLCELVFLDLPAAAADFATGQDIAIRASGQILFRGDITAVEHVYGGSNSRELRLRCYDRLHRLRKRQNIRSHVEARLDELIAQMTASDGVSLDCPYSLPVLRHIVHWRTSDFDLLARLTERFGFYFWLDGTTLRLLRLASAIDPVPLCLGDNLLRAGFERNDDASCTSVRTAAWDPASAEPRSGEARTETDSAQSARWLVNELAGSDAQAQLTAQGELDRRRARLSIFTGLADGDVRLKPGAGVSVHGVAPNLAETYSLTSVTHRIDPGLGFVSEISTEPPPGPDQNGPGCAVSIGIVTQVQDPERRGRIRVRLPAYNDAESGWLPVVLPGIGEGKGVIAVPNIGDTVVLVEPGSDPSNAIVIGGIPGSSSADMGVQEGRIERFIIRTAAPHTLSFDDATRTIRLEDASKSSLEFSPAGVVLHAAVNLRIEAPGKQIKIVADKIDLERG